MRKDFFPCDMQKIKKNQVIACYDTGIHSRTR